MDAEPLEIRQPVSTRRSRKRAPERRPYQHTSHAEITKILTFDADGISHSEIARSMGISQQTISEIVKRHDPTTGKALSLLKANGYKAAEDWIASFQKAVSRGDHRPMKDLLVATGVIAPDPLAQGMVVIVGNGQATQTHVPQGFLLPDDTIDVKACEGAKLSTSSTTDPIDT